MKGTFVQGEIIVFTIEDELVLAKYKELKKSGELESYVNKIFAESVLHAIEDKYLNSNKEELGKLMEKLDVIQNQMSKMRVMGVQSNFSPSITNNVPHKEIENGKPPVVKEKVKAGEVIKTGTKKKKGLSMAGLMSKANAMKTK